MMAEGEGWARKGRDAGGRRRRGMRREDGEERAKEGRNEGRRGEERRNGIKRWKGNEKKSRVVLCTTETRMKEKGKKMDYRRRRR